MAGKFLGFVIHAPDMDDYYCFERTVKYVEERAWVKVPQLAKRYNTRVAAERVRSRLDVPYRTEVWELWETETQFLVYPAN